MMKWMGLVLLAAAAASAAPKAPQPNVLWVLTDDHRYDSIRAFNHIMRGEEDSPLGYVESPRTDQLAAAGTTFINAFCHAQGCAPSRASMHYGRYPFRTGIYEFEWHNNNAEHTKPSLPEQMVGLGYQTFHVGKLGVRVRTTLPNGRFGTHQIYEQDLSFHKMLAEGYTGWSKGKVTEINGVRLDEPIQAEWFVNPDGSKDFAGEALNQIPALAGVSRATDEKFGFLRMHNQKRAKGWGKGEIIGGVSSRAAGNTRDGWYTRELIKFLEHPNETLTIGSQTYTGVDPSRPLFANIGYDFPHTPVLPPPSFRARFQNKSYTLPQYDQKRLDQLPPQLKHLVDYNSTVDYTAEEMQQMVRDYYAFCAYGDSLVGDAVDAFVAYSTQRQQPWMVIYVCGDHGWKLNEHGSIYKFSPWDIDSRDPVIVVSSDKKKFPAGKVVEALVELVDIAPTAMAAGGADLSAPAFEYLDGYDLAKVASGELAARDYIVGESHAVTGPRATLRTPEYMFSIKCRPDRVRGKNMDWARNARYEELEPVLYHLTSDPEERVNLAFNPEYERIAQAMKEKLINIVLGDNRVEVDWKAAGEGTQVFHSNFAPGADDKKLKL